MKEIRNIQDTIKTQIDEVTYRSPFVSEIRCGYGYHGSNDRFTLSYLDEEIFDPQTNTVPISGVQSILEHLFGVKGNINIPTLYNKLGIGAPDEPSTSSFLVPQNPNVGAGATSKNTIYMPGQFVQLFGIGLTGPGENNISVRKVGYRETEIEMVVKTKDGDLDGIMLPFRFTESSLDPNERQMYFGKKLDTATGKTGYYLKRFEGTPQIKHIWRSKDNHIGAKVPDVEATNETVWDQTRDDALKSLIEFHLKIDPEDVKEYFMYKLDQPEAARFNTMALYTGYYTERNKEADDQFGDYCNITLFSKLNIPTEPLSLEKDLEFIYRIYGS